MYAYSRLRKEMSESSNNIRFNILKYKGIAIWKGNRSMLPNGSTKTKFTAVCGVMDFDLQKISFFFSFLEFQLPLIPSSGARFERMYYTLTRSSRFAFSFVTIDGPKAYTMMLSRCYPTKSFRHFFASEKIKIR